MNRKVLLSAISLLIAYLIPLYVVKADSSITHAVLIHEYDADAIQGSQIDLHVYPTAPRVNQTLHLTAEVQNIETITEGVTVGFYVNGTWIDNKSLDSSGIATTSYIPKKLGFYTFTALIFDETHIYYGKVTVQVGELMADYTPYILMSAVILAFVAILVYVMIQRTARVPKAIL